MPALLLDGNSEDTFQRELRSLNWAVETVTVRGVPGPPTCGSCFQGPPYSRVALTHYRHPHLAVLRSSTPTFKPESKLDTGCVRGRDKHRKLHADGILCLTREGFSDFTGS